MSIDALPSPPQSTDPANFATKADAFLAAIALFATQANALAAAMNLNSTTDASTSSLLIATGTKTFAASAGKSFQPGMYLVAADAAAPSTNSMFGQVTSYDVATGALILNVMTVRGSGTKAAWVISQSSAGGAVAGPLATSGITGAAASGPNNDITSLDALTVFNGSQKRQTVLAGAATRVAIGTGLAVNLLATTTPVRVSFAGGTGAQGYIDRIATLSADVTGFWSGLTANVVNYLFYDRNTGTGAITGVASVLPYIAQDSSASISVASGQHTYVYDTGQMYVGNGSVATAVDRTAEGECLAGASTITTVTSYAKQGKYRAPAGTTIANGTRMSFNHNIGVNLTRVRHTAQFVNAVLGYSVGDQIDLNAIIVSATLLPAFAPSTDRLTVGAISVSSVVATVNKNAASYTAIALTDVNYIPQVERAF